MNSNTTVLFEVLDLFGHPTLEERTLKLRILNGLLTPQSPVFFVTYKYEQTLHEKAHKLEHVLNVITIVTIVIRGSGT